MDTGNPFGPGLFCCVAYFLIFSSHTIRRRVNKRYGGNLMLLVGEGWELIRILATSALITGFWAMLNVAGFYLATTGKAFVPFWDLVACGVTSYLGFTWTRYAIAHQRHVGAVPVDID